MIRVSLGRVKVKFPWPPSESAIDSAWARMVVPMAGSGRAFWYLPEVDDEVLVAFEHGDMRIRYMIGALWNGADLPPGCSEDDGACSCSNEVCDSPPDL